MAIIDYTDDENNSANIVLTDNNTKLEVDSGTATQSGAISEKGGSFGIDKIGAGELILTGALNYTGLTTVAAGILRLGMTGYAVSMGAIKMQGGTLDLNGHVVTASGISDSGGQISMNNGDLTITSSESEVFAGDVTGQGEFCLQGGGTLTLTGSMSVTNGGNGSIQLENATLQVGNGGTIGSLDGSVFSDQGGIVVFDRSDTYTFSGSLGLATGLEQIGAGTLVISGQNETSGSVLVETGTLEIGASGSLDYNSAIPVTDNSRLLFDGSRTVAGPISGTGSVTLIDGASVALSGASTYTGGTTIQDSTLDLYGSSVAGGITDDGVLQLGSQEDSATFSNDITGSGSVTVEGQMDIALTGANSYSGGTSIAGGTLVIGSDSELGASSGALNFAAPTNGYAALEWASSFNLSSDRPINIVGGTAIFDTNGFDSTIAQSISGSGGLEKSGAGTLTLLATSSFSGSVTVSSGTLQIANGAGLAGITSLNVDNSGAPGFFDMSNLALTVGALDGNGTVMLGNGTLTIDGDSRSSFSGIITGTGSLIKNGSGTLWMAGQGLYSGLTTIEEGILQLGSNNTYPAITGNIVDDATLAFGGSMDYGGQISGTGNVTFADFGTVRLTGHSTYTGTTQVQEDGQLVVDGSISSSSAISVGLGALKGTGTVSSVTVDGGALEPGDNGMGMLRIDGSLTLDADAAYVVDIAPSKSDRTVVTGKATIGGALYVTFTGHAYKPGTTYTILRASSTFAGTFASVTTYGLPAGFEADITYGQHAVFLTVRKVAHPHANLSVSATSSTEVDAGVLVTLTLTLGEQVFATTGTELRLSNGAKATYVSGSGSQKLVFSYQSMMAPGPLSVTGIYSGILTNAAGNYLIPKDASVKTYPLTVTDTAANIAANLDSLATNATVTAITVSDPANPIVITHAQLKADSHAINEIQGPYALKVGGIQGQPYVSYLATYDSTGQLAAQTEYKLNGNVYLSFTQSVAGRITTDHYFNGNYFKGQSFGSEDVLFSRSGTAIEKIFYNLDGTHTIDGRANNLTLSSIGNDTITGGGSGETFVMSIGFGHDTITDLAPYISGTTHDTVSFTTTQFANFDAMMAATSNTAKGARIKLAGGDTLILTSITKGMMAANPGSFLFTPG